MKKREADALSLYLREVSKTKALSPDEEIRTAREIKAGNQQALRRLIRSNLRFVVGVAKNYQNQGVPLEDLINEGNLGLVKAAKRFDDTKNFKFISYAVWWIRQAILHALADQSRIMRIPLNRAGKMYKIMKARTELEQKYGRLPVDGEVADSTGLRKKDVEFLTGVLHSTTTSLNAPAKNDSGSEIIDLISYEEQEMPDERLERQSRHTLVIDALDNLTTREREVIKLYFGIDHDTPHTLDDIGRRINLTRERVRQLRDAGLRRLREGLGGNTPPKRKSTGKRIRTPGRSPRQARVYYK